MVPPRAKQFCRKRFRKARSPTHTLANRALIRAQFNQWDVAMDDVNESLKIKPSPIGYIAKALTLIGKREQDLGLEVFDYVFHDCDQGENRFLLLVKATVLFVCGKYYGAISRLNGLIATASLSPKSYYQILGNMYMKKGDLELAVQTFEQAKSITSPEERGHLVAISLIFGWSFEDLRASAWKQLCENLYFAGSVKEVSKTLSRMVDSMAEDEKEAAHGRILEGIVTRSGDPTMLAWTGRSSSRHSCLPASPDAYVQTPFTSQIIEEAVIKTRIADLRKSFSPVEAGILYGRVTGPRPVRFTNSRLHLPCIVFPVKSLSKDEQDVYHARVFGIGDIEFKATDLLPLKEPRNLVFVNPWIHDLGGPSGDSNAEEVTESEKGSNEDSDGKADTEEDLVRVSLTIEAISGVVPSDDYSKALQLIARLGQPFAALLLLRRLDRSFKRVAADQEIVVPGLGSKVPKDLRVEALEVL